MPQKTVIRLITSLVLFASGISGVSSEGAEYDLFALSINDGNSNRVDYTASVYCIKSGQIEKSTPLLGVERRRFELSLTPSFAGIDLTNSETIWYDCPFEPYDTTGYVSHINYINARWWEEEIEGIYDGGGILLGLFSISPDGRFYYFERGAPHDIYRFENVEENVDVNDEVWFPPFRPFIYRYSKEKSSWERLAYNWRNSYPVVSSDGLFLVYNRYSEDSGEGDELEINESVFCRSDGWLKVEFEKVLGLEISNAYLRRDEPFPLVIEASLSRVLDRDKTILVYYLAVPRLADTRGTSIAGEEDNTETPEWEIIKFSLPEYYAAYDYSAHSITPGSGFGYEIEAEVIDLGIPFDEFDYVRDVRFRSDGRYVSLVGVKDEVRKLYIYDMEEEELHEVEGSEGALTARWLEIIE
jgi:hypothetical protein